MKITLKTSLGDVSCIIRNDSSLVLFLEEEQSIIAKQHRVQFVNPIEYVFYDGKWEPEDREIFFSTDYDGFITMTNDIGKEILDVLLVAVNSIPKVDILEAQRSILEDLVGRVQYDINKLKDQLLDKEVILDKLKIALNEVIGLMENED